jgi:hypothetical protein
MRCARIVYGHPPVPIAGVIVDVAHVLWRYWSNRSRSEVSLDVARVGVWRLLRPEIEVDRPVGDARLDHLGVRG